MAQVGRVYPDLESSPPPPGAYYSVKDQPIPPPATYKAAGGGRRRRGPCCCLFTWLCSILVGLVIAIGIAVLVFWLVVQPRAPKYHVEDVNITGLNISSTSLTSSSDYNTTVFVNVIARNPNKHIGFYYDNIYVTVEIKPQDITVGQGNLQPFYQGHKSTDYINGTLVASVNSDTLSNVLTSDSVKTSNVPLYAKVDVKTRVKIGSWKSRKMTIKVRCNLNVDLTKTSGNQLISKSCKIKH